MASKDLDSGVRAEDLEASFAPKPVAKGKSTVPGLTAKQQKEVSKPTTTKKLSI
tara:strand:+ start:486 stop:647 length:162 start_codon:yes stop_codon:yes gene_type:complete